MSLQLDESSLSDSKMDISDGTTSAGVSPVAEEELEELEGKRRSTTATAPATKSKSESESLLMEQTNNCNVDCRDHCGHTQTTEEHTRNEDDERKNATQFCSLDNRIEGRREMLKPLDTKPQRQNIARTLTESHPLMSPTGSESDSEKLHNNHQVVDEKRATAVKDQKSHNNFPDVVPHREHIQPPQLESKPPPPPPLTSAPPPVAITMRNNLNNIRGKMINGPPPHNKLTMLRRAHSPDLLSSESDADVSQYHATVEANFQSVSLMPKGANNVGASAGKLQEHRRSRRIRANGTGCDDISSLDSISNHSFDDDEDIEHNLASLSPSSSLIDGLDDDDDDDDDDDAGDADDVNDDDDCEGPELMPDGDPDDIDAFLSPPTTALNARPTAMSNVQAEGNALPQYTEAEERRDSRNWQKITLPDGKVREIDMRVIEPYKRVLSHGGYLKAGGHNAIVIFCACHLPDRSRADYSYVMDNLFLYVVKTLEQLVTEDYVLIYLHGGSSRRNVPPFPWLKKCYQMLDRRLRKSLKNMYLVHPTFWIKSIVWMARPFVSAKFWRKLVYVKSLEELNGHVAVERAAIPDKVKQYDAKHHN